MARIRTIKPEFFTSEDIVALSPLARLLYIALWCEADREGRMAWKPLTFKIRYLPVEACDITALCQELLDRGLVRLYGDGLAFIPKFSDHQHVNPRESASTFPAPGDASSTRAARVIDATVTHREERKGKEGKVEDASRGDASRGSRLDPQWRPSAEEHRWAVDERPDIDVAVEVEKFRDYWHGKAGAGATKRDWTATWRNWIRNARAGPGGRNGSAAREPQSLPRLKA